MLELILLGTVLIGAQILKRIDNFINDYIQELNNI